MPSDRIRTSVLIVGGPDVDARLDLMEGLRSQFDVRAAGSAVELKPRFASAGFNYDTYPLHRGVNPVADLASIYALWRLCQAVQPHIVHTFDVKPGVWGRVAARWARVPVVIGTLPGLGSLYSSNKRSTRLVRAMYQPLQKWACALSQATIFQNQDDARQFTAAGIVNERKAIVIPGSGVPTDVFSPARVSRTAQARLRDELGLKPDELVVTMISRLLRSKGVLDFLAAARDVGAHCPAVRFLLIGPEDQESLDRLTAAEMVQLKQTVLWPGPRRDIPTVLGVSDIFVLPTTYREGIPRVLLEAASMALPIITTDSPGCNEVVKHGVNGFLVPKHDPAAIGQAVLRLIEQPALRQRLGQASRRQALERFDLALIVAQTRAVYEQLLARQSPLPVKG